MIRVDLPNIPDIWHRRKPALEGLLAEWGLITAIFLVALASFGLGRLSAAEEARPAVSIATAPLTGDQPLAPGGLVAASRNGSVYHYPWCAGASQISAQNLIWFASEEAAQTAGYSPSKNCKGLDAGD